MRSSGNSRASLIAAMSIAMMGAGIGPGVMPEPRKGSGPERKPRRVALTDDTPLMREIAEWNAAVDARKQAKAMAKQRRDARGA